MNTSLKQALISVLLCSTLITTRLDLSAFKTLLHEVSLRTAKLRNNDVVMKEMRFKTVVLPNEVFVSTRNNVLGNMSTYVQSVIVDENTTVDDLTKSLVDISCRGSPLIRSP